MALDQVTWVSPSTSISNENQPDRVLIKKWDGSIPPLRVQSLLKRIEEKSEDVFAQWTITIFFLGCCSSWKSVTPKRTRSSPGGYPRGRSPKSFVAAMHQLMKNYDGVQTQWRKGSSSC